MPTTTPTLCTTQTLPVDRDGGSTPSRLSCLLSLSSLMPYGRQTTSLPTIPSIPSSPFNLRISSPLSTRMPGRVCRSQRGGLKPATHHSPWLEAFDLLTQDINMMARSFKQEGKILGLKVIGSS
ncbi:MAG: hypothetical protein H6750_00965 [Nitrospiraceae bacterium]|nr:hypothetical protein [Nitrospira sp.]MCB9772882.1 hypothetical protein [Nitrospiraceae bacterium]